MILRTMSDVLRTVRNAEELIGILGAIADPNVETKPVRPEDWETIARLRELYRVKA